MDQGENGDGTLDYEGGWQNNVLEMHPVYRMVENIIEELMLPGSGFSTRKSKTSTSCLTPAPI